MNATSLLLFHFLVQLLFDFDFCRFLIGLFVTKLSFKLRNSSYAFHCSVLLYFDLWLIYSIASFTFRPLHFLRSRAE